MVCVHIRCYLNTVALTFKYFPLEVGGRGCPSWSTNCKSHSLQEDKIEQNYESKSTITDTGLDQRSQISYPALCNNFISHGAPIGFRVLTHHTHIHTSANKSFWHSPNDLCTHVICVQVMHVMCCLQMFISMLIYWFI